MNITVSSFQHIGKREKQEDSLSDISSDAGIRAFTVCDGLGGHSGGGQASAWIANNLPEMLMTKEALQSKQESRQYREDLQGIIRDVFLGAAKGGKTTLASLVWDSNKQACYFFFAGDSHILHLSREESGEIGLVRHSPIEGAGNMVYNCLASTGAFGSINRLGPFSVQPGDIFIVASDGINPNISDIVSEATLGLESPNVSRDFFSAVSQISPGEGIGHLFEETLKRDHCDNITAQIVWFS